MAGLTAEQIMERIANANHTEPAHIRQLIEEALRIIVADTAHPHSFMLADLFPAGSPTVEELVVALEQELYNAMMPELSGWEWDGAGYRNIRISPNMQDPK